jgi:hypothetical protein
MKNSIKLTAVLSGFLGLVIFTLGILNLLFVHPVPGMVYILLSLLFFPPVEDFFKQKFGFSVPFPAFLVLALVIFWFTLGVSDLAEMYGL